MASIGKIEPFDNSSENWTCYKERLDQYFIVNEVDDGKQVPALLSLIGSKTYGTLRDLCSPDLPKDKTYAALCKLLSEHYNPEPLLIAERFRFWKRDQRPDETVSQFNVSLRKLAEHCKFGGNLNDCLRDRFVCGLKTESIQKRLLSEKDLTYEKAIELATAMECAQKDVKELHGATQSLDKLTLRKKQIAKTQPQALKRESPCYRCNRTNHKPDQCRFKDATCNKCGRKGHISPACNQQQRPSQQQKKQKGRAKLHQVEEEEIDIDSLFKLDEHDTGTNREPIWLQPIVNGRKVRMELDTGSGVSIIPMEMKDTLFPNDTVHESDLKLKTYSNETLLPEGYIKCKVNIHGQEKDLKLYVMRKGKVPLFGREWLYALKLDWTEIWNLNLDRVAQLKNKYKDVFDRDLGKVKNFKAKLKLKPESTPKFVKARSVPFAMKPQIEEELDRLVKDGVLEKVDTSEWATPIVPVPKKEGIRICGDFKVTINPLLEVDQHPLPKIEDIFASLGKGKSFSKIDLKNAYLQVEVDEDSKQYLTISTHKGLFRYNRLVFGIASAPAIFQRLIEQVVGDIPNVEVILDDMIVTGQDDNEHLETLEKVLSRLSEYGLKVNVEKCAFMNDKVVFCGHEITKDGLHKTTEKINAIKDAPPIKNVRDLRSFLGLVQYYAKFLPNLATVLHPLHQLLTKNAKWKWTKACQDAVTKVKEMITSDLVLINYDPDLPIILACDASSFGIGTVLSHKLPNGTERPIAFASRSLNKAEKNYSQIDKEALSLIWGIKKFNSYLYGRRFTLVTDHKPLLSIFSPSKGISATTAARLQRYALFLSGYQYDIVYRYTKQHGNCDSLSRLPLETSNALEADETDVFFSKQLDTLPVSSDQVALETKRDRILSNVLEYVAKGKPMNSYEMSAVYQPFMNRQSQISVHQGCLMWGLRVIIPYSLRNSVLQELHSGHLGIVKMKSLARSYVWWPGIDKDLEGIAQSCYGCLTAKPSPPEAPIHPWEYPNQPWTRVHVDFAGPFMGHMFLVIVDSYSKWPIVKIMNKTSTSKTIEILRATFAEFGLCDELVSDNGPQFSSEEFKIFMKLNGIKHITSAPYHPKTNGLAERFVQSFKQALKSSTNDEGTLQTKLSRFLMNYRNTEHSTTGETPAKLMLGRNLTTRLDKIKPSLEDRVSKNQAKMVRSNVERNFEVQDSVMIRDYRDKHEKWIPGVVKTKTGPVSYNVEIYPGVTWRRHADQLRAANVTPAGSPEIFVDPVIPSTRSKSSVESVSQPVESSGPTSPQKAKVTTPKPKEPPPVVELRRSSRTVKKRVLMDL